MLCFLFIIGFVIHKDSEYSCGFAVFKANKELVKNFEAFWDAEILGFFSPLNSGKMQSKKDLGFLFPYLISFSILEFTFLNKFCWTSVASAEWILSFFDRGYLRYMPRYLIEKSKRSVMILKVLLSSWCTVEECCNSNSLCNVRWRNLHLGGLSWDL